MAVHLLKKPNGWTRGVLTPARDRVGCYAVAGQEVRDGSPLRLRGVLGVAAKQARCWVFLAPHHALDGEDLEDHVGQTVEIPSG